ncbi:MAG: phosphotransferase family protein [Candidatus Nanopelagicales bacterium]
MATSEGTRDEAVDPVGLARWLHTQGVLPDGAPALAVRPLGEGHSNLTFAVESGERRWVLRRPPLGPLLPTAHDVVREFRVLELLAHSESPVRVPAVVAVCEDDGVIGAPFYVMETARGTVVRADPPAWLTDGAPDMLEQRHRGLGLDLADALAEIHRVGWEPFVAAGIGRPGGYLERQLRRWVGQREGIQAAVAAAGGTARDLPDYDAVRDWLREHLPPEQEPAVVHGDYKLDNVVVVGPEDGGPRITAVLDWEMATVGDPRADLGYLLSFWPEPGEEHPFADLMAVGDGYPTREEMAARWSAGTGRDLGDLTWFRTLAVWKLAILLEASYHRWLAGMSDDPFFARLDVGVPALLAYARRGCGA